MSRSPQPSTSTTSADLNIEKDTSELSGLEVLNTTANMSNQNHKRHSDNVQDEEDFQPKSKTKRLEDDIATASAQDGYPIILTPRTGQNEYNQLDKKIDTYQKRKGTNAFLGQLYEIKLLMFIFIKAIIAGFKFKLANNMKLAEDLDDLVFNIVFNDSTSRTVFLQAKHIEDPSKKKITVKELYEHSGYFSLYKYFKSYQQIIKNESELCGKGFNVKRAEFLIYTNTDFDDNCNELFTKIKAPSVLEVLVTKDESVFKINYKEYSNVFNSLKSYSERETNNKNKSVNCDEKEVFEYLGKLTFLVNQGNESEVEKKIKDCISLKFDEYNQEEICDNYLKSYNNYQSWCKKKGEVNFLTEVDDYFQIYSSVCLLDKLKYLKLLITNKVNSKGIEFTDTCLERLAANIPEAGSVKLQTIPGDGIISVAKVLQLYKSEDIMFVDSEFVKQFDNKIECNFKHSKKLNTLVYHVSDMFQPMQFVTKIINIVETNCMKKLIVIYDEHIDCVSEISVSLQDNIRYCDLSSEAQQRVANTHITFQNKVMRVSDVMGECLSKLLDDELLVKVLLQKPVNIATFKVENLRQLYYIRRKFKKPLVRADIIDKCKDHDNLLILSNENDLRYKFCRGREVAVYPKSDSDSCNVYYMLTDSNVQPAFEKLHEPKKNVHLLEYKNNQLHWLKTSGSMRFIMDNLEEHELLTESEIAKCCNKDKLVVISDVAGMGKTTVLKSLANEVNEQYPELWILTINLSQYTRELCNIKESNVKWTASELLLNSLKYSSENEKKFLSQMFSAGRVAVFLDGFDEISPNYAEIVIDLVTKLRFSNVRQIYLTTRPQMREYIEKNLHTLSMAFVELEKEEQINFVRYIWQMKEVKDKKTQKKINSLADELIEKMSSVTSKRDIAICGIPLQLRMIVEIYPTFHDVRNILENDELLSTLDSLYEKFLEKKIQIYCMEKMKVSSSNVACDSELQRQLSFTLEEHELIAVDTICSGLDHNILLSKVDQEKLVKILKQEHDITRYGIVSAVVSRNSLFTHRTFAEYLSALYLCSKLQKQENNELKIIFVREVLIEKNYQVLRNFLNGMVDKYTICRPLLSMENISRTEEDGCNQRQQTNVKTPLHVAAMEKNVRLLKYLLHDLQSKSETAKLMINSYYGNYTVLQILIESSASNEYLEVIELLVALGAQLNLRTKAGESVLHLAGNNLIVLEKLLTLGENDNLVNNDALLGAVQSSNIECVKLLISHQASVNWKDQKNRSLSLLHIASSNGSLKIVEYLLEHGAKVNEKDENGRSVLLEAACKGNLDIVKCLLDHGAIVNDYDSCGRSVLYVAASLGHLDTVQCLIDHKANVNDKDNNGFSALYKVALQGNLDLVQCLVENDANVNEKSNDGSSVLYAAASKGNLETVEYLVDQNANVNDTDNNNLSVLYVAASKGHIYTVRSLVELNANVNHRDNDGRSVLYVAVQRGETNIVECLVKHKANINDKDNDGRTVLYVAVRRGETDAVKCLVEHGANVNYKDTDGKSVLYVAVERGELDIVKCLVKHGANVNDKDNQGTSILKVANKDITNYLIEKGAIFNYK